MALKVAQKLGLHVPLIHQIHQNPTESLLNIDEFTT